MTDLQKAIDAARVQMGKPASGQAYRKALGDLLASLDAQAPPAAPELLAALEVFVGCAYQVSTELEPRGHAWCEAWLDQALPIARAAIAKAKPKAPPAAAEETDGFEAWDRAKDSIRRTLQGLGKEITDEQLTMLVGNAMFMAGVHPGHPAPPAAPCVCGDPWLGVVHRADGPCYLPEQAPPAAVPENKKVRPVIAPPSEAAATADERFRPTPAGVSEAGIDLLRRALPFLRDAAKPYEDDGANEPLEIARDIESLLDEVGHE